MPLPHLPCDVLLSLTGEGSDRENTPSFLLIRHFSKYSQLSAADELLGLFSHFCQAETNMDRDRRMMVFQRRENLGHFSCLTHNIHAVGKV